MEFPNSQDASATGNSALPTSSGSVEPTPQSMSTGPTAIERQIAAVSAQRYRKQAAQNYNTERHRFNRFGLASLILLFFLIAIGAALVFTDLGDLLPEELNVASPTPEQTSAHDGTSAISPQEVVPKVIPAGATPEAISIPLADVSLQRPELLEQLVQVYRSQLADKPTDSAALAALNRLQEQSLSELETIVTRGDDATAVRSVDLVSRLFPELADNTRYKYLSVRTDHMQRKTQTEPTVAAEQSALPPKASPERAVSPPPEITAAPRADSSAETIAKKHSKNTPSARPSIRVLSITPGEMIEQRFVPGDGGNIFMVEISYRNFANGDDQSEAVLIARLGIPDDARVLAEVPVDVLGDRGTKRFLMDTLLPGNIGEKYRLNFMLNDEFLASGTLRLSAPDLYRGSD